MVSSAGYITTKCHWNSALPGGGCKHAAMGAGSMCLESSLPKPRYARFKISQIPKEIQGQCSLHTLAGKAGHAYARIGKAWHGLKEAGKIAGDGTREHLAAFGCHEPTCTPGYFRHEPRPIGFTLAVDGLGAKYKNLEGFEQIGRAHV